MWPDVSPRRMFGAMAYLVGARMFAFIYNGTVVVKLPETDKAEANSTVGARPFTLGHAGRFGDWMEFPFPCPDGMAITRPWVRKSYEYVQIAPTIRKRRARSRIKK